MARKLLRERKSLRMDCTVSRHEHECTGSLAGRDDGFHQACKQHLLSHDHTYSAGSVHVPCVCVSRLPR